MTQAFFNKAITLMFLSCGLLVSAHLWAQEPVVIVRDIYIDNQNIFDPNHRKEDGFLYKLANGLHVKTRTHVIQKYLLLKPGDIFNPQLLDESERILRAKRSVQDAEITYKIEDGFADIYVLTKDTWSLKPKVNASHKGGVNKSEVGIQEDNLFGLGVRASLSYLSDGERSSHIIKLRDDNLFGGWHSLAFTYINSSDGNEQYLGFIKPFYALDTKKSYGAEYGNVEKEDITYTQGREDYRFLSKEKYTNLFWGWSKGLQNNNIWRNTVGIFYEKNTYANIEGYANPNVNLDEVTQISSDNYIPNNSLPNNYSSLYPYYAFDFLQNNYQKMRNFDHIGKTEDIYLGFKTGARLGYENEQWSNNATRWYLQAYVEDTLQWRGDKLLLVNANIKGRHSNGNSENVIASTAFKYYHTQSTHFKGYIEGVNSAVVNPDKGDALYLDAESGMRGYPLNYISGNHFQKITLEERYYSNWFPWRIMNVGAAIFYDVGRITGNIDDTKNGTYKDVGIGLRLSNNRSSKGDVIHIDFAYPMDADSENQGWKFSIESKAMF